MKCDECLTLLDQYVEDELDEVTAASLTAHMTTCSECTGAHGALRNEQEIYANYLLDVEPPPHLWSNFRLELENERAISASQPRLRLRQWFAIVIGDLHVTPQLATALVIVTVALAIGLIAWRTNIDTSTNLTQNTAVVSSQPSSGADRQGPHRDPANADRRSPAEDNDRRIPSSPAKSRRHEFQAAAGRASRRMIERSPAVPTADRVARAAEQQYLSAIEILWRDIERHRRQISPPLLSSLETALAEVDRNIAATRRAAREQPGDPVAVQYLAMAYEKKIDLLREVTSP